MMKIIKWFPTRRYFYRMEQLADELLESGLTLEQVKKILATISKWTSTNYPVMGTLVENMLKRKHLI